MSTFIHGLCATALALIFAAGASAIGDLPAEEVPLELHLTQPQQQGLFGKAWQRISLAKLKAEEIKDKALLNEIASKSAKLDALALKGLPYCLLSWDEQTTLLELYSWSAKLLPSDEAALTREQQILAACNCRWLIEFFLEHHLNGAGESYTPVKEMLRERRAGLAALASKLFRGHTLKGADEASLLEIYAACLALSERHSPAKIAKDRAQDPVMRQPHRYIDSKSKR